MGIGVHWGLFGVKAFLKMSNPTSPTAPKPASPHEEQIVGRCEYALDGKRRLTLPAKWRAIWGDPGHVYVFPDLRERCLNIVTPEEMAKIKERIKNENQNKPGFSSAMGRFCEHLECLELDIQNRIRICDAFLEFAELESTVVMIGGFERIRLWSPARKPADKKVDQAGFASACDELGVWI